MAIETGQVITYQDLIDKTLSVISEMCCNIDSLSSSVPAELKSGWTSDIATGETYRTNYNGSSAGLSNTAIPIKATITAVNHSYLDIVSLDTVKSQLTSFLTNRGIATKIDTTVTLRGLLNYISNVSSFIAAKCAFVASYKVPNGIVAYQSRANSYIGLVTDENEPIDQYIIKDFTGLVQSLSNQVSRIYNVNYQISMTCCSSCSSSCSSSSSSSSSSSFFIAYMLLH